VTHGSLHLHLDPSYDVQRNARTFGTVLATPRGFTEIVISGPVKPYSYISDIAQEVQPGDKIYFNYKILSEESAQIAETNKKDPIYPVRYDMIYCAVRGDQIIPIGGWTLIVPILQKETVSPSGIVVAPKDKFYPAIGIVAHIGTPLKNQEAHVEVGDRVLLRKNADFLINIEGDDYYVAQQRHIMGTGSLALLKEVVKDY
jgi:co-chaperonin GroES (HSP10)